MKKSLMKMTALLLCTMLAASGIAGTAFAVNADKNDTQQQETETKQTRDGDTNSDGGAAVSKDETVYVLAKADGSVDKIIVSDWIKNALGASDLNDRTDLTNVENVKGDETYQTGSDGSLVWDTNGNDIYYQGNIEKELPVDLSVTYKLDGQPVSPEELAGKSGRVTIRFDYENKQFENVKIDGKTEKIYVPFAMLTGVLLDDDVFTNVEVSNGKLVNDGSRTAVIGIAFPGLQENLAISDDKLDIPDYVEITADTDSFELGMTATLATNEIFSELDTDSFDSVSDLSDSMGQLTDAMDQLLDGSSRLYDGLAELLEKSGTLIAGIDQLDTGAESLKTGAKSLDEGADAIQDGAGQLSQGLNTLVSNNDSLNGGAKQIYDTLLATANTQLAAAGLDVPTLTIKNYSKVLDEVITSLDKNAVYEKAQKQVTAAVEAQRGYIEQQVTAAVRAEAEKKVNAAVREEVSAQVSKVVENTVASQIVTALLQMDKASYDAAVASGQINAQIQANVEGAVKQQMQSQQVLAQIQSETDKQMASKTIADTIQTKTNEQMQLDAIKQTIAKQTDLQIQKVISEKMVSDEVKAQLAAATEGAKSVIELKSSLDSYNTFYLGLQSYTNGVSEAATGAATLKSGTDDLKSGTSQLSDGASKLYDGISEMKKATPALTSGITQLRDGAMQLSDGLKEFNEEGIQKLVNALDGDLDGLVERLRASKDVSLNFKNFAGADKDMDGQVKFIYRTDSIG